MLAPSSRFSNSAWTGTLEPRKTHEPLTLSGERSTSGHCDQSSILPNYIPACPDSKEKRRRRKGDSLNRASFQKAGSHGPGAPGHRGFFPERTRNLPTA